MRLAFPPARAYVLIRVYYFFVLSATPYRRLSCIVFRPANFNSAVLLSRGSVHRFRREIAERGGRERERGRVTITRLEYPNCESDVKEVERHSTARRIVRKLDERSRRLNSAPFANEDEERSLNTSMINYSTDGIIEAARPVI